MAFTSCVGAVAAKVSAEDPAALLVFVSDEAEAKKKASEGVFFVIYRLCLCSDTLLFLTHPAKGRKECSVGSDGIEVWHARPPRKADLIVVLLNREGFNLQGLLDEV